MNCEELFEKLYELLDRECSESVRRELEVHMKLCRPCWDRFEFEKKLKERLKKSCHQETCSETLLIRIKALLDKC